MTKSKPFSPPKPFTDNDWPSPHRPFPNPPGSPGRDSWIDRPIKDHPIPDGIEAEDPWPTGEDTPDQSSPGDSGRGNK